jgi:hypothetical protein
MIDLPPLTVPEDGRLAENITWFARALRRAGLRIGPGRLIDAIRAVEAAGFTDRQDFYWVLNACFVSRPGDRAVFDQVFRLFWRDPAYLEHMMALLLPQVQGGHDERVAKPAEKRAAEALLDGVERPRRPDAPEGEESEIEIDARLTASGEERLKTLDFEQMSADEAAAARAMIARLSLPVRPIASRRTAPGARGSLADGRATLRAALRRGGEIGALSYRARRERMPNLVALCDISGSMAQYSRMVLHFLHAVANEKGAGWARVHAFTFGTRLTNITRHLATRDVDQALAAAGAEAQDWQGGTRIATCLHGFNRDWSRRVMGQGAVVLLITDGLDRDAPEAGGPDLGREMERLYLSARRLIWVNPLLRWDGFLPRARGVAAMLPHVDSFRAGHSVTSLAALGAAVSDPRDDGERGRLMRALAEIVAEGAGGGNARM